MAKKMRVPRKLEKFDIGELATSVSVPTERLAAVIVDHGSRREESNQMLLHLVEEFRRESSLSIVEPAHMELASPTIDDAFAACVQQRAELIVVHPYFLLPGRHWNEDIPRLAAKAAENHGNVRYLVTAPLGLHPLMHDVIHARISQCLEHAAGLRESCDLCADDPEKCAIR